MKKNVIYLILLFTVCCVHGQASYIAEQLGRDAHHIVQSLGAFVGNESAESQQFDITYMPAGNRVEGVMIINTADYRCTFKMDPKDEVCFLTWMILIIVSIFIPTSKKSKKSIERNTSDDKEKIIVN